MKGKIEPNKEEIGMFCIRSANDLMKEASDIAEPKQLCKSLMYENEITIIMADTNVGKSVFSLQIANEIAANQPVLYIDLEQSMKQFEKRYSEDFKNPYTFNDKLYWVDFAHGYKCPEGESYEEFFMKSLRKLVEKYNCYVVVIDNMTKLLQTDTDSAKNAIPLMDKLCRFKDDFDMTLILIEHTRKMNKPRAIALDDLQGSKMKVNFADSVVAIGRSNLDLHLRYVKHLKCRSSEIEYGEDNVLLYEIKKESNFLGFEFVGQDSEYNHIKGDNDKLREERFERIKALNESGMSNRQIAKELGVTEGCIRQNIKKLKSL